MQKIKVLSQAVAVNIGYSKDRRKRKREHRLAAKKLLNSGTLFYVIAPKGSTLYNIAQWHLAQAYSL